MSARTAVQIGIVVAATVIGAYFQQPQLGLLVGSVLGGIVANAAFPLDPIRNKQDNLSDVSLTSAALGTTKPIVYGRWPLSGNVIWAFPKISIERNVEQNAGGGKGGLFGGQKTITQTTEYRIYLMISLCEGPVSRITKIFYDATLVYDESQPAGWIVSRGLPDGEPDVSSTTESPDTIIYEKPGETLQKFVLFRGTDTQEPWAFAEALDDPLTDQTLEGQLPAYRGTACVGIQIDLGQFGRVPNFRFEVATSQAASLRPSLIFINFDTAKVFAIGATGTIETSTDSGGALAVEYNTETAEALRSIYLGGLGDGLLTAADNRSPVAVGTAQNAGSATTYVVQHADSTLSLGARTGIDPRSAGEIDAFIQLGAGSVASRPALAADGGAYTTLIYTLPNINSIGQCNTHDDEPGDFQRLVVAADPHTIVWNNTAAAMYVSCAGGDVVERITGHATLVLAESIAVDARPTALIVDNAGDCWVTCRDGNVVYRFTTSSDLSTPIVVGIAPDDLVVTSDDFIWVANTGESTVSRIDPNDLSVEFFDIPGAPIKVWPALLDGKCWVLSAITRSVYLVDPVDGSFVTAQVPRGPTDMKIDVSGRLWVACETARQVVRVDTNGNVLQQEIASGLACVVRNICERAGTPPYWIDVSGLDSTPVNYPIFGIAAASRALEDLALAFQFIGIESASGLKFFFKGGAPVATLSTGDMLLDDNGQALSVERAHDREIPTDLTVTYPSPARHFHPDEQHLQIPYPPESGRIYEVTNVAVGFEDAQDARNLVEILLYEPRFSRFALQFRLPAIGQRFEPGDLLEIVDGADIYHAHLTNVTLGQDGSVECQAVRWRSYLYENFTAVPGDAFGANGIIAQSSNISLSILEPPSLPSSDIVPFFLPVYRRTAGGDFFPSATLYESQDGGINYTAIGTLGFQVPSGFVASALPIASQYIWDDANTITVVVDVGVTLGSLSDILVLNGGNMAILGNECLAFGTATLVAERTYQLSHLLRGLRGTEQHTGTHGTNEVFAVLNAAFLSTKERFPVSAIGQTRFYKAVPQGKNITDIAAVAYQLAGTNIKPWAPRIIDIEKDDMTNTFTITWYHRSRLHGMWTNFSGVAWDDDDLRSYTLTIYQDDTFAVALATYTVPYLEAEGLRTYAYDGVQQIADFGAIQADLSIGLRQRVTGVQGYESRRTASTEFSLPYFEDFEMVLVEIDENVEDFEP